MPTERKAICDIGQALDNLARRRDPIAFDTLIRGDPPGGDMLTGHEACGDALEARQQREHEALNSMIANELFHETPQQLPPSPNRKMRTMPDSDLDSGENDPDLNLDAT